MILADFEKLQGLMPVVMNRWSDNVWRLQTEEQRIAAAQRVADLVDQIVAREVAAVRETPTTGVSQ